MLRSVASRLVPATRLGVMPAGSGNALTQTAPTLSRFNRDPLAAADQQHSGLPGRRRPGMAVIQP